MCMMPMGEDGSDWLVGSVVEPAAPVPQSSYYQTTTSPALPPMCIVRAAAGAAGFSSDYVCGCTDCVDPDNDLGFCFKDMWKVTQFSQGCEHRVKGPDGKKLDLNICLGYASAERSDAKGILGISYEAPLIDQSPHWRCVIPLSDKEYATPYYKLFCPNSDGPSPSAGVASTRPLTALANSTRMLRLLASTKLTLDA